MASWSDKQYNSQLIKCPVCLASLANKRIQKHTMKCYENKKESMESLGVVQCPFVQHHILPITFFNHHIEGNCQGVLNHLRTFYQKSDLFKEYVEAPADYQACVPDKYLNRQNKNLLYMLEQHLYGDYNRTTGQTNGDDNGDGGGNAHASNNPDNQDNNAPNDVD